MLLKAAPRAIDAPKSESFMVQFGVRSFLLAGSDRSEKNRRDGNGPLMQLKQDSCHKDHRNPVSSASVALGRCISGGHSAGSKKDKNLEHTVTAFLGPRECAKQWALVARKDTTPKWALQGVGRRRGNRSQEPAKRQHTQ